MKWRVMLELVGPDGTVGVHEVGGRAAVGDYAPRMIGLTLSEGKRVLAALQAHLVQAQAEDHCRQRRCQRGGAQRPLKDARSRRLVSLFGTVKIRAPRFLPCQCAVTCRRTLSPVAEIRDRPEAGGEQLDGALLRQSALGTTSNVNALTLAIAITPSLMTKFRSTVIHPQLLDGLMLQKRAVR